MLKLGLVLELGFVLELGLVLELCLMLELGLVLELGFVLELDLVLELILVLELGFVLNLHWNHWLVIVFLVTASMVHSSRPLTPEMSLPQGQLLYSDTLSTEGGRCARYSNWRPTLTK